MSHNTLFNYRHLCSFQGGGPGEDMADPFNGKRFTMYMFLPMEVVTLSQRIKVVEKKKV